MKHPLEHFNNLMPAEAELLALLAEECGECIQAVGKILRHGYESRNPDESNGYTNRQQLEKEVADVRAAIAMLIKAKDLSRIAVESHQQGRENKVQRYMHHQAPNGGVNRRA